MKRSPVTAALLAVCLSVLFVGRASASPITYIWEGSLSGSLAGNAFTAEPFVLTINTDTANIAPYANGLFVPNDSVTIDILSQTLTINSTTITYLNDDFDGITFSNDDLEYDILLMFNPALDGFDLASPFGPLVVSPPDTFVSSAGTPLITSGGNLLIADNANATLTFTAVPEPASAALLAVGGLVLIRRGAK
ncbi:MAG: hypothetical protein R3C45_16850 [Phycisphaerales bacterium]